MRLTESGGKKRRGRGGGGGRGGGRGGGGGGGGDGGGIVLGRGSCLQRVRLLLYRVNAPNLSTLRQFIALINIFMGTFV